MMTVQAEGLRSASVPAPAVSVIVPAFNVRAHLHEAVQSLLQQSWRDLEVIVIDDASTDGTLQALDGVDDARLTVLRLQRNAGVSAARNVGLARARGEFVALLDGDDVSLPPRIEKQLQLLRQRPAVGLVSCLTNSISSSGQLVRAGTDDWRLPDAALKPLMLFTNPVSVACMVRRSALPAHGFRPMYAEDYAFAADVADTHELALLREPLVNYRLSPNGIMASRIDRVAEGALSTQRRLLLQLGLPEEAIDPRMLRTLMHFGRPTSRGQLTLEWLLRLRAWFELVLQTNRRTRRYEPAMLERVAARMWDMVLLAATKSEGLQPGGRYLLRAWPFLIRRGQAHMRVRSLAHSLLSVVRGPVVRPDPYGRDGERT
jgi:hypothetical protein